MNDMQIFNHYEKLHVGGRHGSIESGAVALIHPPPHSSLRVRKRMLIPAGTGYQAHPTYIPT